MLARPDFDRFVVAAHAQKFKPWNALHGRLRRILGSLMWVSNTEIRSNPDLCGIPIRAKSNQVERCTFITRWTQQTTSHGCASRPTSPKREMEREGARCRATDELPRETEQCNRGEISNADGHIQMFESVVSASTSTAKRGAEEHPSTSMSVDLVCSGSHGCFRSYASRSVTRTRWTLSREPTRCRLSVVSTFGHVNSHEVDPGHQNSEPRRGAWQT